MEERIAISTAYVIGDSEQKRQVAERQKIRTETLVGTCSSFVRAISEMRVERALAVSTPEEVTGWIEVIEAGAKSLEELVAVLRASLDRGRA